MRFLIDHLPILLSKARLLNVNDARGATIRVVRGRVWITQEGSPDDLFLDAGARYAFVHDGRAIVSAENAVGGAAILFEAPIAATSRGPFVRRVQRLVARLRTGSVAARPSDARPRGLSIAAD